MEEMCTYARGGGMGVPAACRGPDAVQEKAGVCCRSTGCARGSDRGGKPAASRRLCQRVTATHIPVSDEATCVATTAVQQLPVALMEGRRSHLPQQFNQHNI